MMFGLIAGVVLAYAGVAFTDTPIKFLVCLSALVAAHLFL